MDVIILKFCVVVIFVVWVGLCYGEFMEFRWCDIEVFDGDEGVGLIVVNVLCVVVYVFG